MPKLTKYPETYPDKAFRKAKNKGNILGVQVKKSTRKNKKIDIFKDNKKICSIGDLRYEDFNQHNDLERRKRFHQRFKRFKDAEGTCGWFSLNLLW